MKPSKPWIATHRAAACAAVSNAGRFGLTGVVMARALACGLFFGGAAPALTQQPAAHHAGAPQERTGEYVPSTNGTRWLESPSGLAIKVLVEESNLGSGEVEVAEITFPAGSKGGNHRHGSIEIFYVVSGTMGHVVNGTTHVIEPGGVAIVKPGDQVAHQVLSDEPVKAVVIWAPGGEAERTAQFFEQRPIEP